MIVAIIIGVICAGIFWLVGPMGIVLIGVVLAMAGISSDRKKD